MSRKRLFGISFGLTAGVLLLFMAADRVMHPRVPVPRLVKLSKGVYFTSQLKPESLWQLPSRDVKTLVDIRPDGEAHDETPSAEMEVAAESNGLKFYYIPVPHESIPPKAVEALGKVFAAAPGRTVLYCRTGRRAVRLFALAEASRKDGPEPAAIGEMITAAGFSADDIKDEIAERVLHRDASIPENK